VTDWITSDFAGFARTMWSKILTRRPDLADPLYPMLAWLYPHSHTCDQPAYHRPDSGRGSNLTELISQAQTVAVAAVEAGQLALSGTDRRLEVAATGRVARLSNPVDRRPGAANRQNTRQNTVLEGTEATPATILRHKGRICAHRRSCPCSPNQHRAIDHGRAERIRRADTVEPISTGIGALT
jgi:hypothetical protein